ncbi:MAG: hypothetical protein HQL95_09155 [Magnetococcales bacterium]|nr:hypothetical protein [Magnetococcales bacterium]
MRPADQATLPSFRRMPGGWLPGLFLLTLLLLGGCGESGQDPVLTAMTASDTLLERVERFIRPGSYWSRRVTELEKQAEEARKNFESHNQAYHAGLLARREAVHKAVEDARSRQRETREVRQEAIQQYRRDLAHSRDLARDAGRNLRIRLALLRKAREQLDRTR